MADTQTHQGEAGGEPVPNLATAVNEIRESRGAVAEARIQELAEIDAAGEATTEHAVELDQLLRTEPDEHPTTTTAAFAEMAERIRKVDRECLDHHVLTVGGQRVGGPGLNPAGLGPELEVPEAIARRELEKRAAVLERVQRADVEAYNERHRNDPEHPALSWPPDRYELGHFDMPYTDDFLEARRRGYGTEPGPIRQQGKTEPAGAAAS